MRDLLNRAKYLIVAATFTTTGASWGMADHSHTIDRWDDATGENLIEQIAAVGDYLVALETYRAAVRRWPGARSRCATEAQVLGRQQDESCKKLRGLSIGRCGDTPRPVPGRPPWQSGDARAEKNVNSRTARG